MNDRELRHKIEQLIQQASALGFVVTSVDVSCAAYGSPEAEINITLIATPSLSVLLVPEPKPVPVPEPEPDQVTIDAFKLL